MLTEYFEDVLSVNTTLILGQRDKSHTTLQPDQHMYMYIHTENEDVGLASG